MSVTIPNDCAHTFSPTHRHVNIGLVTSFYSDYWTELGPGEGRGADWAESGLMVWEKDWKRNEDWEMNGQRRGYCWIAEKETCRGGRPQIHGFDICVLLDSLLAAHFSCPLHAYPPTSLSVSHHLPHWSAVNEGKTVWEGAWDKTDPFSLDAVLRQASRDTFKDEGEVNVVGRMRELL